MRIILWLLACFLILSVSAFPCTTAVVSGKYTVDGRPILLKHRDSDYVQNKLMFFRDGKYEYIGLVNSSDTTETQVWAGCNSVGFAIMNSADYNLNIGDTTKLGGREGYFMRQALQVCATVDEFEEYLRTAPKPLGVEANFGVIDAKGGAAYFETGNFTYTKFDANDPKVAPFGYLIRTNYAFTGNRDNDFGLIRYRTADELFYTAANTRSLSFDFILKNVSRCLKNSLTKTDLTQNLPDQSEPEQFVWFQDFIPRYISSASVVFHGVKAGESPTLTTMWTILGFPLSSIAIPTWVAGAETLPALLTADASGNAPICSMALKLKERCFPIERESGKSYLNLAAVMNKANNGILQKLQPIEEKIIRETDKRITAWRKQGKVGDDLPAFYRWIDDTVQAEYKILFGSEILTK
jgi:hypothetical protein